MPRGRLKLVPITNNSARNRTFRKRTKGIIKKVNELATLCGVDACAVINSDITDPEFSPSKEGAEAVCSRFMGVLPEERSKKMYDQERYLWERIQTGKEKARKLDAENREIELREVMFDLLKGKTMSPHHYSDPGFLGELNLFIGDYFNKLTHRTEYLEANGAPNVAITYASRPVVGDVNPFAVKIEGSVSNPTEVYDHMSVNEQAHGGFNDHVHHQNMNHQQPFQYQSPGNCYDQTQPWFNGSSQNMYTGLSHDQGQSSNQYPNSNQSFMSPFMGQPQQMSDVQALASVASMDDNSYGYHQLPITSQMPLTTTTTATPTADLSDHSIGDKRWPTRFGLD